MPKIELNKKEILKLAKLKINDDELNKIIPMLGTDLEEMNNDKIVLEIFPNRPDLLSAQGFARALSSFMNKQTGLKKYTVKKSNIEVIVDKNINKIRPYTVCAVIKNLKLDDQKIKDLIQIQEKLHITFARNRKNAAIGIYPLEKIKSPVYFKALNKDTEFIPLEFNRSLSGLKILQQHPAGRDYSHLLEGLDKFPFFIDANNEIMSMPPIINSNHTGKITETTKEIFIEVSGFDLKLQNQCLNMLVCAIADMGGDIHTVEVVYPDKTIITPNLKPRKMSITPSYVKKYLGLTLLQKEINKLLGKMGFGSEKNNILIPAYRTDILHPIDLVEDIAIAYGYDNISEIIPNVATIGEESKIEIFEEKLRDILIGQGLLEVKNYNISSKEEQTTLMNTKQNLIEIKYSISDGFNVLRTSILPSIIHTLKLNKNNEYPQNIFEIGRVFLPKKETWLEQEHLAVTIAGDVGFTEIRQIIDAIMNSLDIKVSYSPFEDSKFISGRCASVIVKGKQIGLVGELAPVVLSNWKLDIPVSAFEINIEVLLNFF